MTDQNADVGDRIYIKRQPDAELEKLLESGGETITIRGLRQMGKSSLLYHVLDSIKTVKRSAVIGFQFMDSDALSNADQFFRQFCSRMSAVLGLENEVESYFKAPLGYPMLTTRYLSGSILKKMDKPLVLAMDEVDRLFDATFRSDFFGMLRSWHGSRMRGVPAFQDFYLVLVTATEPHQFITDPFQSPFNVSQIVEVEEFTPDEVAKLNTRYGSPLSAEQLQELIKSVSGHPYLVHQAIASVAAGRASLIDVLAEGANGSGPLGDHLRAHLRQLQDDPELHKGLRQVLSRQSCGDLRLLTRLLDAGLVIQADDRVIPRNRLYKDYFGKYL